MLKYEVKNQNGEVVGERELSDKIFSIKVNESLIHQAVVAQTSNQRQVVAHTKNRSEVRGGGRKPWRQKGTGRARAGSRRSPIWIGGGITFGPRSDRNFSKKINKKMKTKAFLMALSDKAHNNLMTLLDKLELEKPKTKLVNEVINKVLNIKKKVDKADKENKSVKKRSTLIILEKKNEDLKRAFNNLPDVELINLSNINIVDLLKYKNLILTVGGVKKLEKMYGSAKK